MTGEVGTHGSALREARIDARRIGSLWPLSQNVVTAFRLTH